MEFLYFSLLIIILKLLQMYIIKNNINFKWFRFSNFQYKSKVIYIYILLFLYYLVAQQQQQQQQAAIAGGGPGVGVYPGGVGG
jgi:hypothetical protein